MEFRILGPIEVLSKGRQVRLGGVKQRALLAVLLLHRNEVVSVDRLIDELWGDRPPATAVKTVQVHVSQLRKALRGPAISGDAEEILVTRSPGYVLRVGPDELDADRFERLVEDGRQALRADAPEQATELLLEALSLWRGPALADFTLDAFAQAEIGRLEEARVSAIEERIDADLAAGRGQALIGELETLIRAYPLRERLRSQLMLALYRSDRQAEALAAYQDARRMLDEELGLEPSESLQHLERAILVHDTALDLATPIAAEAKPVQPVVVRRRGRRVLIGAAAVASLVVVAAILGRGALGHHAGLPNGSWKIGVDLPLSGDHPERGVPARDAIRLAIDQANTSGGAGGVKLGLVVRDDADPSAPTGQSEKRGVANAKAFVADPAVIAMIGPRASVVASKEIPITNAAGLLQCSHANTDPSLTKPRNGALDLRTAAPQRINYIRTAPSDDIQGPAAASFLFNDLGVRRLLVIDDTDFGRGIADSVGAGFVKLGGTVIRRALNPGANPSTVIGPLSLVQHPATGVFFGGFADTGAPQVRKAMVAAGLAKVPFVSWDGIGGSGSEDSSFLQLTGRAAVGSYQSHASTAPPRAAFVDAYRSRFGREPDEYAATAYACAEVILGALRKVAEKGVTAAGLREALRAEAVDPAHQQDTVLGSVGFDANGDSLQQFVTFYRVDPSAADGKGDWAIEKQQDYGPAP